jgi:hypothetical protein
VTLKGSCLCGAVRYEIDRLARRSAIVTARLAARRMRRRTHRRPASRGTASAWSQARRSFRPSNRRTVPAVLAGSAAPHEHDLVLGYYSVHTTPDALRDGEARIAAIKTRLAQQGRL